MYLLYLCIYVCIYIYIHVYICIYIHIWGKQCISVYTYIYVYKSIAKLEYQIMLMALTPLTCQDY